MAFNPMQLMSGGRRQLPGVGGGFAAMTGPTGGFGFGQQFNTRPQAPQTQTPSTYGNPQTPPQSFTPFQGSQNYGMPSGLPGMGYGNFGQSQGGLMPGNMWSGAAQGGSQLGSMFGGTPPFAQTPSPLSSQFSQGLLNVPGESVRPPNAPTDANALWNSLPPSTRAFMNQPGSPGAIRQDQEYADFMRQMQASGAFYDPFIARK